MKKDNGLLDLRAELEKKLFQINDYFIKFNEQIANIKAIVSIDKEWIKKLQNDKSTDRILNKYSKSDFEEKELNIYFSIIEVVLKEVSKYLILQELN